MNAAKMLQCTLVFLSVATLLGSAQEPIAFKRIRECLLKPQVVVCLKEEAVDILNRTIMNEKPMRFFDMIDIEKDPNYKCNTSVNDLPEDLNERSAKLNDILYHQVEDLFESRTVRFSLANVIEGRKKKDKTGSMLMMGGLAMAGMMGQMFMGKIAFLAGAALLIAKMALMMSVMSALRKTGGGGGGGAEHIVYATSSDSGGYGHSHGGWHRSLTNPDPTLVYAGQMPTDSNYVF
ncbi:hypothetical protein PPYR_11348 [Photinus pyralis]|uniref:Protein osiris 16 n=1 Tax=Photinus pyralis TaxID=7054 RepID=A0A1Y1M5Z4_PHOPY|nr:uncharacterized protein LOC116177431 [Photinus pyralis]XP_031352267.1 uncharacterized protein LOC116177431 [Photinus pyralis]XP_031352268.1 uncharacterized protein LOC116177431 [Photinus pyralis]KAB0794509.1 hypothetical protein PPYR_11348 [Photinus pyralis]